SIPSASRLSISRCVVMPPATISRREVACRIAPTVSIGIPPINPSVSMCVYKKVSQNETEGLIDRKSTRLNSSHLVISYAVFCLKKKTLDENIVVVRHHAEQVGG